MIVFPVRPVSLSVVVSLLVFALFSPPCRAEGMISGSLELDLPEGRYEVLVKGAPPVEVRDGVFEIPLRPEEEPTLAFLVEEKYAPVALALVEGGRVIFSGEEVARAFLYWLLSPAMSSRTDRRALASALKGDPLVGKLKGLLVEMAQAGKTLKEVMAEKRVLDVLCGDALRLLFSVWKPLKGEDLPFVQEEKLARRTSS